MIARNLPFTLLGVVASAALWIIGVIGFAAYETNRKPHQNQISLPVMEAYGANKVYRSCQGLFYDGKLDAKEFMLLCMKEAQKERERKEAELVNPTKPQTSKPLTPPATRAADASR